jgi:hypothetical protein
MSRHTSHCSDPWLFGEGERGWWSGDGDRAQAADRPEAGRGGPDASSYLESSGNTVEEKGGAEEGPVQGVWPMYGAVEEREYLEVKACGCRSRFCPDCCTHLALKLRERLVPVLKTFSGLIMLTLTVDPKLFDSPEQAYWYVKDKRAIAELVRALLKAGHVKSGRFFYVVEWHKNGWTHFHLLVEADRIPFEVLAKLWGRHRPKSSPPWEGSYEGSLKGFAPEFGTVHVSKEDFANPEHAAHYALKYMMKLPERGFPDWVLDSTRQIRMFQPSQRLFDPQGMKEETPADSATADENGASIVDLEATSVDESPEEETPFDDAVGSGKSTIRERLAKCGQSAVLMQVFETVDQFGRVIRTFRRFLRKLPMSFADALAMLEGGSFDLSARQGLECYAGGGS